MSLNLDLAAKIWRSALPKGCSRLVLQCFTHHLNDEKGLSWPSIRRVAHMCGMSERTVQLHVRALQAAGILRARLRTGHTTHYSIHLDALTPLVFKSDTVVLDVGQAVDNSKESVGNSEESVGIDKEPVGNETQPEKIDKEIVENFTLTLNRTLTEPPGTAAPALPVSAMMIDSVNPKVLADFAAIRKAKRKGAVTAEVIEEICQQAHIAGLSLEQALKHCCHPDRKWARFEASWMQGNSGSAAGVTTPTPAAALWKPPVSIPARPEIRAAEMQRQRQICQTPSEPVAGIQLGRPGPGWAHAIVHKYESGQPVSKTSLREACLALKITPASLSVPNTH